MNTISMNLMLSMGIERLSITFTQLYFFWFLKAFQWIQIFWWKRYNDKINQGYTITKNVICFIIGEHAN